MEMISVENFLIEVGGKELDFNYKNALKTMRLMQHETDIVSIDLYNNVIKSFDDLIQIYNKVQRHLEKKMTSRDTDLNRIRLVTVREISEARGYVKAAAESKVLTLIQTEKIRIDAVNLGVNIQTYKTKASGRKISIDAKFEPKTRKNRARLRNPQAQKKDGL